MKLNLKYLIKVHAARDKTKGHYGYIFVTKVFLKFKGGSACMHFSTPHESANLQHY